MPLSDEQIDQIWDSGNRFLDMRSMHQFARAIEAAARAECVRELRIASRDEGANQYGKAADLLEVRKP